MLTCLHWSHIEAVKQIYHSTHCSKLYMMDHFHSLELKCDTEIAFRGSQMDQKNPSNIKTWNTWSQWNTSYNISQYKNYKKKLFSIWRKEEKMYYQTESVSNKNNLRKVWTIIKQVINRKKSLKSYDRFMYNKNIVRHTAHTIVSWPNPKQWLMIHTSDLMMIIRQSTHSHDHHRRNG